MSDHPRKPYRVIVAGSRTFNDRDMLHRVLIAQEFIGVVVCGEARGADQLGREWAEEHGIPVVSYPADWDRHGRAAGPIRNAEMAKNADKLVAFWDGKSRGTRHMIETAEYHGLEVEVHHV